MMKIKRFTNMNCVLGIAVLFSLAFIPLAYGQDAFEPDDTMATASLQALDSSTDHTIDPLADQDWIYFVLPNAEGISIRTTLGTLPDSEIWLYDSVGNFIAYNDDSGGSLASRIDIALEAGTYYVQIAALANIFIGSYSIAVEFIDIPQDAFEPDNTMADANLQALNSSTDHDIVPLNDQDWIYFVLPNAEDISIRTTLGTLNDSVIWLYDSVGNFIAYDDDSGGSFASRIDIALEAGTYYVQIMSFGGYSSGSYSIAVEVIDIPNETTIDIDPNTLNLKGSGSWVTVYIELTTADVNNIDISTVKLEGTISAETKPVEIGDYDEDGIPDLMVKFSRPALIEYLDGFIGSVELTVSGEFYDGTGFEGSDTIEVK